MHTGLKIFVLMTKTKSQKQRAKAAAKPEPAKPMSKTSGKRKQRTAGDQSVVRGNNGGQYRERNPQAGVIEKQEQITLVSGTTGFQALKFPINPGLASTFPAGSSEAVKWTEWQCTKLSVSYIPTVSEFATQGQQGEVAIAVDYNADNVAPTAMNQIELLQFAGGGIPSRGFDFHATPKYMNKADPKYVRTGPVPAGDDLRLYDGGNIYFATSGCSNTTQIGKLIVTYRFEVRLPTLLNQGGGGLSVTAANEADASSEAGGATGVAHTVQFATNNTNPAYVNTAGEIVPPLGNYVINWVLQHTFTGSASSVLAQLDKNGVATPFSLSETFTAGTRTVVTVGGTMLVTANGTDSFSVRTVATYSTGTDTISGIITFTPV